MPVTIRHDAGSAPWPGLY